MTSIQQAPRPKKAAAYTNDPAEDLLSRQNRKAFMSAAYFAGTALGLFAIKWLWPDIEGTDKDVEVLKVFGMLGWALLGASALLLLVMIFMRGALKMLLMTLNWFILPAVLVDALLQLADILWEVKLI